MNVTTDERGVSVGGDQVTLMVGATSASRPQTTCATDDVVMWIVRHRVPRPILNRNRTFGLVYIIFSDTQMYSEAQIRD